MTGFSLQIIYELLYIGLSLNFVLNSSYLLRYTFRYFIYDNTFKFLCQQLCNLICKFM